MIRKMAFIIALSVVSVVFLGAEKIALTLDDAVKTARINNLDLQKSGIALQGKERAVLTAWNVFLPAMTLSTGFTAQHGIFQFENNNPLGLGDSGSLGFNAGAQLSLPLNFAALGPGIKKLKTDYEAGLLDYEAAVSGLEKEVRKQFYSILTHQENIRIQKANRDLAQKRYKQTQGDFNNGLVPELDVFSAEVSLLSLQPTLNNAIQSYNSLVLQFKTMLGIPRTDEIELIGEFPTELYEVDAEALIDKYMASRLDVRSLDKQLLALDFAKRAAALNANFPMFKLGYAYALRGSNASSSSEGLSDSGTISLGLEWKLDGLIPGSKTNVAILGIQDSIDSLRLSRDAAWRGAGAEITNLVGGLGTYRLTIEANVSGVELSKKNYELTEDAYQSGTRQLLDVESAQNDYLEAQQRLLMARYSYITTLLDLAYALNVPVEKLLN